MPDSEAAEHSGKTSVKAETKKAIVAAIDKQLHQAVIASGPNGAFQVDASLSGTARDAAKTAVMNQAQRQLCKAGYAVTLTCDGKGPGKATYYFDFNTDKGKERVVVGVAMDNDRAAYLIKRSESIVKKWLGK